MSLDPLRLSRSFRRLMRRSVCRRFGHSWRLAAGFFACRVCRVSGHDAYYGRRRHFN